MCDMWVMGVNGCCVGYGGEWVLCGLIVMCELWGVNVCGKGLC